MVDPSDHTGLYAIHVTPGESPDNFRMGATMLEVPTVESEG